MPSPSSFGPQQDKMHPNDRRNLIIFLVLAVLVWLGYDQLIMKPKMEAYRAAQILEAAQQSPAGQALIAQKRAELLAPRPVVLAQSERIPLETPQLRGSIALTGGRIDDILLTQHTQTQGGDDYIHMLSPAGTDHPRYAETGWIAGASSVRVPNQQTVWRVVEGGRLTPETPLTLAWDNGAGLRFERKIAIDDHFLLSITQRVINNGPGPVALAPFVLISQHGIPPLDQARATSFHGPIGYVGENLYEIRYNDLAKNPNQIHQGMTGWIGFTEHYWLVTLLPEQKAPKSFRFLMAPNADLPDRPYYQTDITHAEQTVMPGDSFENTVHLFAGAKKARLLDQYEQDLGVTHFDLAVDFGLLYFLTKPFYWLLTTYYGWVGSFGIAILMMTVTMRLCVFPLANISYKTFAKLKKVAPQMKELQERFKDDRAGMQQGLVKLYQTEKVNPMAGCLPILVQIPIFFALYKVLSISIEMRHTPFFGWIDDLSLPDPTSVFNLFGLLPYDVPDFLNIGAWPCLMLLFMLIQKQMNPPPTDPIQKTMMNVFPFVMVIMLASFPSGLVIYWTASNLFSIIQQYVIMRSMGVEVRFWGHEPEAPIIPVSSPDPADDKAAHPAPSPEPPKPKKKKKK